MTTETNQAETTSGALALLTPQNMAQHFAARGLEPIIDKLREEVKAFVPDISTKEGRAAIKSFAYKLAQSKTALDKAGKELVSGMKEQVKAVDNERSRAWDEIEKMQEEVRKPLTDWENAEKERVAKHEAAIGELSSHGMGAMLVSELEAALAGLDAFSARDWQEFKERAHAIIQTRTANLVAQIEAAKKAEADRLELERLQREEAARKQREHEERIAAEAAEKAKKEAEELAAAQQAKRDEEARLAREATEKRAEQDRLAKIEAEERAAKAEADAKEAAAKAEIDRIAAAEKAEREKKEAEQRAAAAERKRIEEEQAAIAADTARREDDAKHKKAIMKMAIDALENQIKADPDLDAEGIIKLIASGAIPNVKINY